MSRSTTDEEFYYFDLQKAKDFVDSKNSM